MFATGPIPDTGLPPADEAVVASGRRTVALRDFRPGRARPEPPEDSIQHPPIIGTGNTTRLVGQQRRQD